MKTYEMSDEEKEFLAGYDLTKYDRPSVAADVVVFSVMKDDECEDVRRLQEKKLKILLIRRGGFPYKGSWAMPGGFCRKGEDVIDSARRDGYRRCICKACRSVWRAGQRSERLGHIINLYGTYERRSLPPEGRR